MPGTIPHSCAPHEPLSFSCAATSAAFIDAAASRAITGMLARVAAINAAQQRRYSRCQRVPQAIPTPQTGSHRHSRCCQTGNRTAPRSRRQRCAATRRRLERAPHALVRTAAPGGATRRDAKGSSSACASHAHALAWSLWSGAQAGRRAGAARASGSCPTASSELKLEH